MATDQINMKLIGIDTGGTYTDAVRYSDANGVEATAKARTETDLTIGIGAALDQVVDNPDEIGLVSLSTTLATNALVQGVGGRVALIFIGFNEGDLGRAGLKEALGDSPVIFAAGGHDSLGNESAPLDAAAIAEQAAHLDVDAFAVSSQFSVRDPSHELAAMEALLPIGKPVACSHQLSAKLNGPRRALTCLLNARLIGLIAELCHAASAMMAERSIDAPLMIVRGDGSLVAAEFALNRPIETILSGPAASLVGAGFLTGEANVIVSDIGGTTTDVGILTNGEPSVLATGATVGGHQTMVEAVAMHTHGLGGDSAVDFDTRSHPATVKLGPRRLTPLSLLAVDKPTLVLDALTAASGSGPAIRGSHTQFVRVVRVAGAITEREQQVLDAMGDRWQPLRNVASTGLQISALHALIGRGLVQMAGFTPSDAAHVVGLYDSWNGEAATLAATLLASMSDSSGLPLRPDGVALSQWVIDSLVHRSAEMVLATALDHDGYPSTTIESDLVQRALSGDTANGAATAVSIAPTLEVVGLGASAATYYPMVTAKLGGTGIVPQHAEVANAVGAVVSQVRLSEQATISQPTRGQYRVHFPGLEDRGDLQPAIDDAIAALTQLVQERATEAGAAAVTIDHTVEKRTAVVGAKEVLVEATVTVSGRGRPRLG